MVEAGLRKTNVKAAVKRLEGKLPADVSSLVHVGVESKSESGQPFDEASLAKALKYLNQMMVDAWKELDEKVIECKEFEDRNRGTFEQVMTDIARLAEQIADLERMRAMSVENIATKEQELIDTTAMLKKVTTDYMKTFLENKMEMTIRQNDLAVFQFMLKLVKCKTGVLVQLDQSPQLKICESEEGLVLNFGDKELQAEVERRVTPKTRSAIREVLGHVTALQAQRSADLLQYSFRRDDDDGDGRQRSKTQAAITSLLIHPKAGKASTADTMVLPHLLRGPKIMVQAEASKEIATTSTTTG